MATTRKLSVDASGRGFVFAATALLVTLSLAAVSGAASSTSTGWLQDRVQAYSLVWPQHWAFFTGMADDDILVGYRISPARDGVAAPVYTDNGRAAFTDRLGGLDRSADAHQDELRQLATQVPEKYWQRCDSAEPAGCRNDYDPSRYFHMDNHADGRAWCGRFAVALERPVRVDLSDMNGKPWKIIRIALVDAACTG